MGFSIYSNTFAIIEFDIHETIFVFWQYKLRAIHKRRLLKGGGRGSPLKADLQHKSIK